MTRTAQYMTQDEIRRKFNTTKLEIQGNIIQVQDFQTKEFHYFTNDGRYDSIEGDYRWVNCGVTSLNGEFFNQPAKEGE